MERKIGEIFEYNGEWYQCVKSPDGSCKHCDMNFGGKCPIPIKECVASARSDLSYVIFKKLEKVGEPYRRWLSPSNNIMVQRYRLYDRNVIMPDEPCMFFNALFYTIEIEIKQTKEDMEEKKLNLKPFDLEAAKEGKPVYTRDGRKARILCFDKKDSKYPIVALIDNKFSGESTRCYSIDGKDSISDQHDLFMAEERREAWIKLLCDASGNHKIVDKLYKTKAEAEADNYLGCVANILIKWEE